MKKKILDKLDSLDKKAETCILSPQEVDLKQYLKTRLAEMLREEEIKWYQRAKVKELLEGHQILLVDCQWKTQENENL